MTIFKTILSCKDSASAAVLSLQFLYLFSSYYKKDYVIVFIIRYNVICVMFYIEVPFEIQD